MQSSQPVEIGALIARLAVRYGSRWASMYAGIEAADVIDDWRREVGRFSRQTVIAAWEAMPSEWPPNAAEFRDLCMRVAHQRPQALPPPKPSREGLLRIADAIRQGQDKAKAERGDKSDAQHAAEMLERRIKQGRATPFQREALRNMRANAAVKPTIAQLGDYKPVPAEALPLSMRVEIAARGGQRLTEREIADTLEMARRILGDENATRLRRQWASDVIAWLAKGDHQAARRVGYQGPEVSHAA